MNLQIPTNLCNCVKKPEKKFFFQASLHNCIAQLVEHHTGIGRSWVQIPLKS